MVDYRDDPEALRRDIEARRRDLAVSIGELKEVVSDKLDVRKRAEEVFERGKLRTTDAIDRVRTQVRARPALAIAVAASVVGLLLLRYVSKRRRPEPNLAEGVRNFVRALSRGTYIRIGIADPRDEY